MRILGAALGHYFMLELHISRAMTQFTCGDPTSDNYLKEAVDMI
jgi:hypothetical protein